MADCEIGALRRRIITLRGSNLADCRLVIVHKCMRSVGNRQRPLSALAAEPTDRFLEDDAPPANDRQLDGRSKVEEFGSALDEFLQRVKKHEAGRFDAPKIGEVRNILSV